LFSVASAWEMQIKLQLDRLKLTLSLAQMIENQRQTNNIQVLFVTLRHVLALQSLPAHHKDPFDRLLVAQANAEDAVLLSSDQVFAKYPVKLLW